MPHPSHFTTSCCCCSISNMHFLIALVVVPIASPVVFVHHLRPCCYGYAPCSTPARNEIESISHVSPQYSMRPPPNRSEVPSFPTKSRLCERARGACRTHWVIRLHLIKWKTFDTVEKKTRPEHHDPFQRHAVCIAFYIHQYHQGSVGMWPIAVRFRNVEDLGNSSVTISIIRGFRRL